MAINALNSGAKVWLADFEDANTPHWANVVGGQVNLYDAVRRTIELTTGEGKEYRLRDPDHLPVILPRPRGWHLHGGAPDSRRRPVVGALVDFGLYFFHNAAELLARGSGPYFYLPKMESHLEARLWNDVFSHARAGARHRARHDPRHRPDRDDPGGVRDGGDPLRAARPLLGPERRPLGLPVLHHQDAARRPGRPHAARSQRRHHERPDDAGVRRSAGLDLPPPRRLRDGRDGGVHPVAARRGGQRGGVREGARGQDARGHPGLRRLVGRPPRPGAAVCGDLRRA